MKKMKTSKGIILGLLVIIIAIFTCACSVQVKEKETKEFEKQKEIAKKKEIETETKTQEWENMKIHHSLKLQYANQFSVDYYENGYGLITIQDGGRFLVVPESAPVPSKLEEDVVVLQQPLNHIYLVATSAMDLFRALDGMDNICLSGTDSKGWYIEEARQAMEEGKILYAGKYSMPDYEVILSNGCDLAVESTMIYHTPEVKEQLESFHIPVLVERSSYESHPLGRMEWIKLYGVLLGKEAESEQYFQEQLAKVEGMEQEESTGKTVAFFYINSNGSVNVRKSGDYVAKMIEMAGGKYVPSNSQDLQEENSLSTMNMQMEAFYAEAKDADYLIYNSAIDGEIKTKEELLKKSELLKDFKAVKEGNVWCTQKNMFQQTTGIGEMISDIHKIITEEAEEKIKFIYRLQ